MQSLRMVLAGLLLAALTLPALTQEQKTKLTSGLEVGTTLPAYNPQHVVGPDRGTRTCPI